jgi:hypothetical protein
MHTVFLTRQAAASPASAAASGGKEWGEEKCACDVCVCDMGLSMTCVLEDETSCFEHVFLWWSVGNVLWPVDRDEPHLS